MAIYNYVSDNPSNYTFTFDNFATAGVVDKSDDALLNGDVAYAFYENLAATLGLDPFGNLEPDLESTVLTSKIIDMPFSYFEPSSGVTVNKIAIAHNVMDSFVLEPTTKLYSPYSMLALLSDDNAVYTSDATYTNKLNPSPTFAFYSCQRGATRTLGSTEHRVQYNDDNFLAFFNFKASVAIHYYVVWVTKYNIYMFQFLCGLGNNKWMQYLVAYDSAGIDTTVYEHPLNNQVGRYTQDEWNIFYKQWAVQGKILEDLDVTKWRINTYSQDANILVSSQIHDTSVSTDFVRSFADATPVYMSIFPETQIWKSDKTYSLNDVVYPTSPIDTPYYYRCDVAGQSSSSEPVWPTSQGGTITDNTVTWTRIDRIVQPQMHGPIIPLEVLT